MKVKETLTESPQIIKTLERAFDRCGVLNGWTPEDIILHTLQDPVNFHIWKIVDGQGTPVAYASTRTIQYPQHSALSIVTLANVDGDPTEWGLYKDLINKVEEIAIASNYDKIEITGRLGWKKRIKPMGMI